MDGESSSDEVKICENLLWGFIGALDVAEANDADKKPVVSEYARHIIAMATPKSDYTRQIEQQLESNCDGLREQRDHWLNIAVGVYRRFYPHGEYGVPNDPTDMINDAIDAIERDRDEWKAKAEKRIVFVDGERYEPVRECELEYHETGWVSCRICGTSWPNDRPHVYRRCPYCGAKVVKR